MNNIKFYLSFSFTFLVLTLFNAQSNFKSTAKDFGKLAGSWEGSLTYLDYSTGKPYTMSANIEVRTISKTNKFIFLNSYPKEKNANSIDTILISKDGQYIDKELVKSRHRLTNGTIEIITEELGKDGNANKPAFIRHTYTFGKSTYSNIKEVKFTNEDEWIKRHKYLYRKKSDN